MVSDLNIFVWKLSKIAAQKKKFFLLILLYKTCWKPRFPMDERPLVEGYIASFGISLDFLSFCILDDFFRFKKFGFFGILGPPYRGIGAIIRIGWEMLCLPYMLLLCYVCYCLNILRDWVVSRMITLSTVLIVV